MSAFSLRPYVFVASATVAGVAAPAAGQVHGHVSVLVDVLPDVDEAEGTQQAAELRARVHLERRHDIGRHLRLNLAGDVDGLVADRPAAGSRVASDAIVRPADLYVEWIASRFDVRVGSSRLVWGRLDELQPTDVVNPLDLTRFLLDGRSEARLPVGLVRGRVFLPGGSTLEGVVVPVFRSSRFDQLAERTSPFNLPGTAQAICPPAGLGPCRVLPIERREPPAAWRNAQGGARFTSTLGRVDWALSAYRGFRTFPLLTAAPISIVGSFPRFTMLGSDFETVRDNWGIRGELAVFVQDELQATLVPRAVPGRAIDSGIGVDRRAGDYRMAGSVLWSYRRPDAMDAAGRPVAREEVETTDVTIVGAADRSFAAETRTVRLFAAYDPADDTVFVRGIAAVSVHDNVWIEGSAGMFVGAASDTFGRLTRRDFIYARLRVHF